MCQEAATDENRWRFLFTFAHSLINGGGLLQSVGCGNPFFNYLCNALLK